MMATFWTQSKRLRSCVAPRASVTSENVSRPGDLFGMSAPPSKYSTLASSTESSEHFWNAADVSESISTVSVHCPKVRRAGSRRASQSGGTECYGFRARVCWAHRRYGRAWRRDVGDGAGVS